MKHTHRERERERERRRNPALLQQVLYITTSNIYIKSCRLLLDSAIDILLSIQKPVRNVQLGTRHYNFCSFVLSYFPLLLGMKNSLEPTSDINVIRRYLILDPKMKRYISLSFFIVRLLKNKKKTSAFLLLLAIVPFFYCTRGLR